MTHAILPFALGLAALVPVSAAAFFPTRLATPRVGHQQEKQEDPELAKRLRWLVQRARDRNVDRRVAAWRELLQLGEVGRARLLEVLERRLEGHLKAFDEEIRSGAFRKAHRWLAEQLQERRQAALECIRDPHRYPEENHGAAGQGEVDRLVGEVRDVWKQPALVVVDEHEDLQDLLDELAEDLHWLTVAGGEPPAEGANLDALIDRANASIPVEELGLRDSTLNWNRETRDYNREAYTSVDDEEHACIRATNEYRWMLGLRLLEIDERLVRAARKHSEEMVELGYFAHDSPVEANRSPSLRIQQEGFRGGAAENIAISSGGRAAFEAWYHSSGHHRNMLGGHVHIGIGRSGRHYTENLATGRGPSLRRQHEKRRFDDPLIQYLVELRALDAASADDHLELARWCRARQLDEQAVQHARRALELEPDHAVARKLLEELERDAGS